MVYGIYLACHIMHRCSVTCDLTVMPVIHMKFLALFKAVFSCRYPVRKPQDSSFLLNIKMFAAWHFLPTTFNTLQAA